MTEKLKPCPFCGGEPTWDSDAENKMWYIRCVFPSCPIRPCTFGELYKDRVVDMWNQRAAVYQQKPTP